MHIKVSNLFINKFFSNYPEQRSVTQKDHSQMGVPGTLTLLQNIGLSTQPASSFDWSADKLGLACTSSFDQTVRVLITTKLNTQ
jgi:hypothetical protein